MKEAIEQTWFMLISLLQINLNRLVAVGATVVLFPDGRVKAVRFAQQLLVCAGFGNFPVV